MENTTSGAVIVRHYLEKYAAPPLHPDTQPFDFIITIPAHRETQLKSALESLAACDLPDQRLAVFVLLNYSEDKDASFHSSQYDELNSLDFPFPTYFFLQRLPPKHAGVGLARKMLMDQAARQLPPHGVIVCLDADCTVDSGYFTTIAQYFSTHPNIQGASLHFEHPLDTPEREAILAYELHLRYYIELQRWIGLPYAYHTVGSAMAVRNETYCKTGGMNKRKAGEDFYFLQKIIPHGFGNITTTTIYPSPRPSDRVPFGTGRAVNAFDGQLTSYSPESAVIIKQWIQTCEKNWNQPGIDLPEILRDTAPLSSFGAEWIRIQKLAKSKASWDRQFYAWFDGFLLMKALHHLRDNQYPNLPVQEAAQWMLKTLNITPATTMEQLLKQYRQLEISRERTN